MQNNTYVLLSILVMAVVTALLRCLPFFVFGGKRSTSPFITYLGRYLPYAMMGMLVIYCYKSVSFASAPFGAPELIAGAAVVLMHKWKHSTLLSILGGTVLYMVLVQIVFG